MRRDAWWLAPIVLVLALAGLFSARNLVWRTSAPRSCDVCRRPIRDRMRTVASFAGRREVFCCPACALSAHRQSQQPVRVLSLADFDTAATLEPDRAWVVTGSDVNVCMREHEILEPDMHVAREHFDRCSPSLVAFGRREQAEAFVRDHGGRLLRFPELAASYSE